MPSRSLKFETDFFALQITDFGPVSNLRLKAPLIDRVIPLSEGPAAYDQVARGDARGRLVLAP